MSKSTIGNRIAEQATLNTMNKLIGQQIKKQETLPPASSDDSMRKNAREAVERGAALLDARVPGWASNVPAAIQSIAEKNGPQVEEILVQLGIFATEGSEEAKAFIARREGEEIFHSFITDREKAANAERDDVEAALSRSFLLLMMAGIPIRRQETDYLAHTNPGQIDLAFYGFDVDFYTIGLPHRGPSFPSPKAIRAAAEGFCIEKSGRYVAEAWNDAIAERKGK